MALTPTAGGFAYLPLESMAFSRGVIALRGYALRRIRLSTPMPMEAGFAFAAEWIRNEERPIIAFCGCELRIPRRLPLPQFGQFNKRYIAALQAAGFTTDPINPAARTNMAPAVDPPADAVLHAFTFTIPAISNTPDYLISGAAELDPPHVIAPNDTSPDGMRTKAQFVMNTLRSTVETLGGEWDHALNMQIYTQHPMDAVADLLPATKIKHVPGDPPLYGPNDVPCEFEADIRSVSHEEMVETPRPALKAAMMAL